MRTIRSPTPPHSGPHDNTHKLESSGYMFVADSVVSLHANFRGDLRKRTHFDFWNRMCNGRSRSSKVVDFGTNRKRVCDFPLLISSNFGPILHRRFWDMATYWPKTLICLRYSHLTPSLWISSFEFLDSPYVTITKVLRLSAGENFVMMACVVLIIQY